MLNPEQLAHFQTFGFVTLSQVFTTAERKIIDTEYEIGLNLTYKNKPFDGKKRYWAMMLGSETPFFSSLAEDSRFYELAEQLYGDDVFAVGCDANRYVGDTGWHPDHQADPEQDCYGMKIAFYLDPVDDQSGALRVIPGSHRNPLHDSLKEQLALMDLGVDAVPAYTCVSQPGDIVVFDLRLWHASSGGSMGRRMCTVVYYKNPETPAAEQAARKRAEGSRNTPAQYDHSDDTLYPLNWVANRGNSKRRQRWLERLQDLGFIDTAS